jgi:hypothetical protein
VNEEVERKYRGNPARSLIHLLPHRCARTMWPMPIRRDEWKAAMKDESLSKDEYEALAQIVKLRHGERPSACVARNSKRLSGIKFISFGKDGRALPRQERPSRRARRRRGIRYHAARPGIAGRYRRAKSLIHA